MLGGEDALTVPEVQDTSNLVILGPKDCDHRPHETTKHLPFVTSKPSQESSSPVWMKMAIHDIHPSIERPRDRDRTHIPCRDRPAS